jgi:mono/diheme cytochrome c family protein
VDLYGSRCFYSSSRSFRLWLVLRAPSLASALDSSQPRQVPTEQRGSMSRGLCVAAAFMWLVTAAWTVPQAAGPQNLPSAGATSSAPDFRPILIRYCVTCHNQRAKTGGLALDTLDLARVPEDAEVWEKVVRKLRAGVMPPPGLPRPDMATHDAMAAWLETTLDRAAAGRPNPGQPAPHRLNRAEYANAIRDLLTLDVDSSSLLPPDDSSDGFDNNAEMLRISPALLERYLSAARKISALAVGDPRTGPSTETYRTPPGVSQTEHFEGLPFGTRGGLLVRHTFPVDGEYVFKVKLLETTLGGIRGLEYANQVEVLVDGERVHLAEVGGPTDFVGSAVNATDVLNDIGARLTVRVPVKGGPREVAAAFLAKSAAQGGARLQHFLRSNVDTTDHLGLPHLESVTILGPFDASGVGDTPTRQRIFVCRPTRPAEEAPCARKIIATLTRRAYRRPVTDAELEDLVAFYEVGRRAGSFETGIERALRSILASPKFVLRLERHPAELPGGAVYRISDLELASRLSFFLWSSIPDDQLLEAATQGKLKTPAGIEREVRRMLADPKSEALISNFAGQWLQLRNLRAAIPDQNDFPDFDDNLRQAFRRETEMLFESIMREDRSVLTLMNADYTFANERLAKHYGIPNVYGSQFRRVPVRDEARKGLLGHGSMLMVTSHPDRTSPVLRGKWILENLLGTAPPPPPANVPPLEESQGQEPRTVRQQMEAHRKDPACAGCHRLMDPLGIAMENFDAVGAWRTRDADAPIDAGVEIFDGTHVSGAVSLREALLKRSDVLVGTFTERLLTYALGRRLEYYDRPTIRAIVRDAARNDYRFSSVMLGIVNSTPFQKRMKASG